MFPPGEVQEVTKQLRDAKEEAGAAERARLEECAELRPPRTHGAAGKVEVCRVAFGDASFGAPSHGVLFEMGFSSAK